MAITYRIDRSTDGVTGWTTVASGLASSPDLLTGQPVNHSRYYKVYKEIDGFVVAWSNVVKVLILSPPTLVALGGTGADRISLTWSNCFASSYRVYKYSDRLTTWQLIGTTSNREFFDFTISNNIYYWYYVTSISAEGEETIPSNIESAIIIPGGIFSMGLSRATNYQGIQIGIESTPGTAVSATHRLVNIELMQTPQIPIKTVKFQGYKGTSGTQRGKRHTEAKFNAVMDYSLMPYIMVLGYGAGTQTTANSGTTWYWNPDAVNPITPVSATIEQGSSKGAEKFAYATLADFAIKWSKEDASLEGSLFGTGQIRNATLTANLKITLSANAASGATSVVTTVTKTDGTSANGIVIPAGTYVIDSPFVNPIGSAAFVSFTSTASATVASGAATFTTSALAAAITSGSVALNIREVLSTPVDPETIACYISTDGVTYTLLTDVIDGSVNFNGLHKPSFHVNDADTTFDDIVELDPNITASLTVDEGSEADTIMGYLDAGQKIWLGIKSTGSVINASPSVRHSFRLNIPMYVTKPDPGDKNDVYGNTFSFDHAHDQAFGQFQLTIVNRLPNL